MKHWYQAKCYRCREEESGETDTMEQRDAKIANFKTKHQGTCGSSAGFMVMAGRT